MGRFGSHLLNRASCHGFGSSPSDPNLMSQAEFFHVRCGRCCLGKGTRLSPQTAMRGLRASRAAAALALAVMAACLAPCGVGASGFDAAAQGRARARETHRHRRAPIAPRLTSLSPPSAHVSGGAVLTITGVGFEDTAGLAVRFAASRGAPDGGPLLHETRARFVSRTKIECVAPRIALGDPISAHVSVSNGDGVWSAPPLVHVRSGATSISNSALLLEYEEVTPGCPGCGAGGFQSNLAPERRARERWVAVPERGADKGGSLITIRAVGYALNDFDDPHNTTLAFDVRDVDDALPPGFAALLGGAPSGGPGSRGRGGAARGGVSPTAATFGARPRGTFFPGPGLRCRFECPVRVSLANGASYTITGELLDARVAPAKGVKFLDFASVACVAPPFPGEKSAPAAVLAALPANATATVSRVCRVALSNDHGVTFDDGSFANAARATFRYVSAPPSLRGAGTEEGDATFHETFFPRDETGANALLRRAATTRHSNRALLALGVTARGPLSGNTEVTLISGDDDAIGARAGTFAPNAPEATCRFVFGSDAPLGPRAVETRATVAPDGKSASCVSPPRPVGIANDVSPTNATNATTNASSADYPPIATHDFGSPCFFASVALSNDGVTFSDASTAFLYCDTHVAPLGEHVHSELAYGTPSRPFPNLQSAFAASLAGARRDERSRTVNRDALRLAPGTYGGEGNVELHVAHDQVVDVRAVRDDANIAREANIAPLGNANAFSLKKKDFFLLAAERNTKKTATVACGGDRPLFASTRDANGVSFSPSVLLDGCHFDGREAVTGTRCASRRNAHVGGCAGDDAYVLPERNMDAAGGTARDPYSWEAFDYDDALEYGEFRSSAEAFYEFA